MQKQFQILAASLISVAIVSCSKQDVEMPETTQKNSQEISTSSSSSAQRPVVDPLLVNLEGRFEFNGDLKDQTRKLDDGISTRRVASYGTDRKGNLKSALNLDSTFFVKLSDIPQQTKTSISVWIKPTDLNRAGDIVSPNKLDPQPHGPKVVQSAANLMCAVATDESTPGQYIPIFGTGWYHVVVTFDGANVRVYINNVLKSTIAHPFSITPSLVDYVIGYSGIWQNLWKGKVDDLRFYSRTLSASDVQKLYNL